MIAEAGHLLSGLLTDALLPDVERIALATLAEKVDGLVIGSEDGGEIFAWL